MCAVDLAVMIKALLFDVFGTLVDWRTSVADQMAPFTDQGAAFADAWRGRYQPSMEAVRSGARAFVPLDTLHRESLDATLDDFGISASDDERRGMTLFWHRLSPWADVTEGLAMLGERFVLAPHSNGNVRLMVDLARHNGWRWDAIMGAETTGHYKPQPESYLRAAALLMLQPEECAMVAAHNSDLAAARACGFRTMFIPRPLEHGPGQTTDLAPGDGCDHFAETLPDLARALRQAR
ncbi:haloacid dehalogenase type II [Acuticoccus sp. MNP-M23]|uniref:haloacid dehalogenase type II n=1 Tax=Acuticoccus sp. MNP-M23 TaxID=3072793 RepID=UPI00281680CC|nr:haloacid dehalogenase type II [Acuticoccus sp. MNP-M23]WMS41530.1 haloacid dehalogenase type II [Acuticoccus sp. MNP-M23]